MLPCRLLHLFLPRLACSARDGCWLLFVDHIHAPGWRLLCSAARAPPRHDQLASFYKLVGKVVMAAALCRHARHAELSAQAAVQAEALFGDNSLVVADLRMSECMALSRLDAEASGAEKEALLRLSLAVLLSIVTLLLRRLEVDTLLPGSIREEELDYEAHALAAIKKAKNEPALPPAVLRARASTLGYSTVLLAMFRSLDLLPFPYWQQNERKMVLSFVLRGLDIIPRTAGIPANSIAGEKHIVRSSKKTCHRSSMVPPSVMPCSASRGLTQ